MQIAVAMGATVTGVASGSKADLVTAIGAQHVIDYTRDDFADGSHRYDAVVDIGGMTSAERLFSARSAVCQSASRSVAWAAVMAVRCVMSGVHSQPPSDAVEGAVAVVAVV